MPHRDSARRRTILQRFVTADDAAKRHIATVVRHLEAVDRTQAWALAGCSSLYDYCIEDRGWSKGQTAIRVQVALGGRRVPRLFDMLDAGELTVSSAAVLVPKLRDLPPAESRDLLDDASGLSKRAIEELLAARFPKPDVPDRIRKVPSPRVPAPTAGLLALVPSKGHATEEAPVQAPASQQLQTPISTGRDQRPAPRSPQRRERVQPLAADRFQVQLTVSRATRDKLRAVQALMSHRKEAGLEQVLDEALGLLETKLLKERFGVGRRRRGKSKSKKSAEATRKTASAPPATVPAAVRAIVYERDGGACTYVDPDSGRRCGEQRWLQLDHIVPRCRGGTSTADNLRLLCAPHNRLMAREILGDAFMDDKLARTSHGDRGHPR